MYASVIFRPLQNYAITIATASTVKRQKSSDTQEKCLVRQEIIMYSPSRHLHAYRPNFLHLDYVFDRGWWNNHFRFLILLYDPYFPSLKPRSATVSLRRKDSPHTVKSINRELRSDAQNAESRSRSPSADGDTCGPGRRRLAPVSRSCFIHEECLWSLYSGSSLFSPDFLCARFARSSARPCWAFSILPTQQFEMPSPAPSLLALFKSRHYRI